MNQIAEVVSLFKRWQSVQLVLDSVLRHFEIDKQKYPDSRGYLQACLVLLFSFVYLAAWLAHIPIYIVLGNYKAAALVALLGISSALLALLFVKHGRNTWAGLAANLGGLTVLLAITMVTGATHSPIPAWLFFGVMTSFLLLGAKVGWIITLYIISALCMIFYLNLRDWLPNSGFPFDIQSGRFDLFTLFVYIVSIISLSTVTTIYDYLQHRGFSELKMAMGRIQEQNESILAILNTIQQGLFTILPDGRADTQYSSHLSDILLCSRVAGEPVKTLFVDRLDIDDEKKSEVLSAIGKAFGKSTKEFSKTLALLPLKASLLCGLHPKKCIEIDWVPMSDKDFKISKILVVIRDVTLIRKLEDEAIVSQQERISQSKMAALGQMAGGIAHEINNPLAIIDGQVELISASDFTKDKQVIDEDLASIRKQVRRIGVIIKSLLSFARQGDGDQLKPVDLRSVVEDTLELTRERSRKQGVQISLHGGDGASCVVLGDHSKLMQIVLNVVNNSFQALEDNGDRPREIVISWKPIENSFVLLSIHDNGCGIKKEIRENVMQPFFTTKPIGKGTGLGLSISKGIVEQMGGEIYFESEPHDTTMFIKLKAVNA